MGRLGARQREVLVMRNGLSQPYGEIARTLGISIGTVKSRIGRARGSLRVLLEQAYSELQPRTSLFECFEPLRSGGRVAVASL
jgi:RNA polymerase sigma-70 factor (ECF subfamily)